MDDTASQALLFAQVAEAGSFSAAARRLGRTPSSVSRQLDLLEDSLGITLLHRSTRSLSLTEAGKVYLAYAERVRAEVEEGSAAVARFGAAPVGRLRVSAPAGLALLHISPLLPAFFERYPDVEVALDVADRVVDVLAERYDVAIRFGRLPASELKQRKLAESYSAVCASPHYLERRGVPCTPAELAEHACLSFRTTPGPRVWRFLRDGLAHTVNVRGPLTMNSGIGLCAAALDGLGVVLLPSWHVARPLREGRLVRLLSDYEIDPPSSPVHAVFAPERHLAPKVRVFVDFIAEAFAAQVWEAQ